MMSKQVKTAGGIRQSRRGAAILRSLFCAALFAFSALFGAPAFAQAAVSDSAKPITADDMPVMNAPEALRAAAANSANGQAQPTNAEDETEKSWFLSFVESKLSAPNRRITITGLQGVLSSGASVGEISVADNKGVWLRIRNAKLDWNRLSLLRGRLSVNSLSADTIEILRKPLPNPETVELEAKSSGFSMPDIPVGIYIGSLNVRQLLLGQDLIGQPAALSLEGKLDYAGGALDTDLSAKRLDGQGGDFRLMAKYNSDKRNLDLNALFEEPQNGILANLMQIEGKPPLHFTAKGGGKDSRWLVRMHAEAASRPILDGQFSLRPASEAEKEEAKAAHQQKDSSVFDCVATGPIAAVLPAEYKPFFGEKTGLNLHGAVKKGGGFRIDKFQLSGNAVYIAANAETSRDGFLRRLLMKGAIGRNAAQMAGDAAQDNAGDNQLVTLPMAGGGVKLGALRFAADYGAEGADKWTAYLALRNLQTPTAQIDNVRLNLGGAAENLDNPQARHISANLSGSINNIALAQAAQGRGGSIPQIDLSLQSDWRSRHPIEINNLSLKGGNLALTAQGAIDLGQFSGSLRLVSPNIADAAALLGKQLSGAVNIGAQGTMALSGGVFDMKLSGGANNLLTDSAAVNNLLKSDIALSGGIIRNAQGIAAQNLRIANGQFRLFANGALSRAAANLGFSADLADLALLQPFADKNQAAGGKAKASGAISLNGAARGHNGIITLAVKAAIPQGVWNNRAVRNLQITLNGLIDNTAPFESHRSAVLSGTGQIGGDPLRLDASLHQQGAQWRADSVNITYGQTQLAGFLRQAGAQAADGANLWNGEISLKADDIAPLAALAFMDGKGSADLTAELKAETNKTDGKPAQNAYLNGAVKGLALYSPQPDNGAAEKSRQAKDATVIKLKPLITISHLAMNGRVINIFGLPQIDGAFSGQNLAFAGRSIEHFAINSAAHGQDSAVSVNTALDGGIKLSAAGVISPFDGKPFSLGYASAPISAPAQNSASAAPVSAQPAAAPQKKAAAADAGNKWQFVLQNMQISGLPASPEPVPAAASAGEHQHKERKIPPAKSVSAQSLAVQSENSARFVFSGGSLERVDRLLLNISHDEAAVGSAPIGFVKLNGALSPELNCMAEIHNLPLALADAVRPDLGLRGAVSGKAQLSGALSKPIADFDLNVKDVTAAPLASAGIAPVSLAAQGQTKNDVLSLQALLSDAPQAVAGDKNAAGQEQTARGAVQVKLAGQIFLAAQKLDLTADADAVPLNLLAKFLPHSVEKDQKIGGSLTAHAAVSGAFANPQAQFNADVAQLSAPELAAGHIAPLNITAAGKADKQSLALQGFSLRGPRNLEFSASGILPYKGEGLDMAAKGSLPLGIANAVLSKRGAQADGLLTLDARLSGALANPQMTGSFAVNQGKFVDSVSNIRLTPINIAGRLSGSEILLDKLDIKSFNGGDLTAGGSVSLDSHAGYPIRMNLSLNHFGYNDGAMIAAKASGGLTLGGAVMDGMEIGGTVTIDKAEIRVPDSFGGASQLDIENKNITPRIAQTQARAGMMSGKAKQEEAAQAAAAARYMPKLNVQINAPNQIFVRGRGLDAEMGGKLHITGLANAIIPTGGFDLIRGRMDILAQRLVFRKGQVTLRGSLNPALNFVAVSQGDDVTVTVTVSGTPDKLTIALSSDPSLPQDEILARLIFKRSLSELTPIQVAQLVDATAELTGVTQHSVLSGLRTATGLDQLDVITDSAGNAGVSAGRYIMNNLYLGVETTTAGASKGTVNLDITPRLKAKGSVGTGNDSNVGIFYERDY